MDTIPTGPLARDKEKFLALLAAARDASREDGHWKLVSVSLDARTHIDPLAVLESIYEPTERHCYIEHPERGEALAGAESVVEATFSGPERFIKAREFAREVFDNTIAVGQLDLPLAGPKIFSTFTFEDDAAPDAPFAPATLFVPRWQVSSSEGAYVATANLLVTSDGDIEEQARRALDAHAKFSSFSYERKNDGSNDASRADHHAEANTAAFADEKTSSDGYRSNVAKALEAIRAGRCVKVVLSRRITYISKEPLQPIATLARLRERFPSCAAFSVANGKNVSFIGASPERLVRMENGCVETEALAGTTPRGATPSEDAALAAALIGSEKQLREHRAVADTIAAQLAALGLDTGPMPRPRILRLPNAQHIKTPFRAPVKNGLHLFDIAAALHPTPATSGLPRANAMQLLRELEAAPRGLYSGIVGWCGETDGELTVALRSGEISGASATLYAGAGIVEGSDPEEELQETGVKMNALADSLGSK
jgi:menaquinone-specific isochorismate synthase